MALAEMADIFPIFARRSRFQRGLSFTILCIAAGKTVGPAWRGGQRHPVPAPGCPKIPDFQSERFYIMSDNNLSQKKQKQYEEYVKAVTPVHSLPLNMCKAFFTGGVICVVGQVILNYADNLGLDKDTAGSWCSLILILFSVILTGCTLYSKIGRFGGAGSLVPITGFANSVASSAIEYKAEGQVFGIGCKIFTIAGPVILYGILSSWILGVIYYLFTMIP